MKTFRLITVMVLVMGLIGVFSASGAKTIKGQKEEAATETQESKTQQKTPAAAVTSQPLEIKQLYLKGDTVHVVLATKGSGKVRSGDYAQVKLTVEITGIKKPGEWTLLQVDPKRRLTRARGTVDFDTGLELTASKKKVGTQVKATLSFEKWKTAKQETLFPMTATAAMKTSIPGIDPKKGKTRESFADRIPAGRQPEPVPLRYDHGIDIIAPTTMDSFYPGETITIRYRFSETVDPGDVTFSLMHHGSGWVHCTVTDTPPRWVAAGTYMEVELTVPDNVPPGPYLIDAYHPVSSVTGGSDEFEILDSTIEVTQPHEGNHFRLDANAWISWRMPEGRSDCGDRVRLDLVSSPDRTSRMIHGYDRYEDDGGSYQWYIRKEDFEPGMYRIKVLGSGGCIGSSRLFRIDGCDYSIESVHGSALDDGVDASGRHSFISGIFTVVLQWNGEEPPINTDDVFFDMDVISTRTGASLRNILGKRDPFNYTQASRDGRITVSLPFVIQKDDIHSMLVDTSIPFEIGFTPGGTGLDTDAGNNTFAATVLVRNYTETDLQMSADLSGLYMSRRPKIGPRDEYYFNQQYRVRNLSRAAGGGPPDPIDIRIGWHLQYKDPGHTTWAQYPDSEGEFNVLNVGEDWSEGSYAHRFEAPQPSMLPDGRLWRILFVADPRQAVIDPNRHNNQGAVIFSITD